LRRLPLPACEHWLPGVGQLYCLLRNPRRAESVRGKMANLSLLITQNSSSSRKAKCNKWYSQTQISLWSVQLAPQGLACLLFDYRHELIVRPDLFISGPHHGQTRPVLPNPSQPTHATVLTRSRVE